MGKIAAGGDSMRYRAVVFDFDYTLGDATDSIYDGFLYGFEKMGYPAPEREAVRQTVGHILEDEFTMITGEADPDKRAEFRRWFQARVEGTQAEKTVLLPGAAELLTALHGRGVKLGVVSSKRASTLRATLAYHGVLPLLDVVTGGNEVSHPKPHPEGLLAAVAALEVERSGLLYCGDTAIDAETAQRAEVDFAAVLCGTTPASAFDPYPKVHVAQDLPGLRAWLGV